MQEKQSQTETKWLQRKGKKTEAPIPCKQIIKAKQIPTRLELACLAVQQEREGKTSLAEFIANKGYRVVDEALALAKEFSERIMRVLIRRLDLNLFKKVKMGNTPMVAMGTGCLPRYTFWNNMELLCRHFVRSSMLL